MRLFKISCGYPGNKTGIFCYNLVMNVGIDARMLGPAVGGGGLGRYVEQLVKELLQLDQKNRYLLFLKNQEQTAGIKKSNTEVRITNTHWSTFKEQWMMPGLIYR